MERRNAILSAARDIVALKGVKATSVAEIAFKAGVAKGLIFYYFKDKPAIISELAARLGQEYLQGLSSLPDNPSALQRLHDVMTHHFDFIDNSPLNAQFLYQSVTEPKNGNMLEFYDKLFELIREILRQGIKSGEFCDHDSEEVAYMILGSLHGVGRLKLFEFKRDFDAVVHLMSFYDKALRRVAS
ncbi:MAG: TetR/AcrR family transcriptional regulator [Desulfovibrio sp.]|nr:TetR/AcrR family transcriptional regulator [Desulfovibrio sp.]